jgi:hypothetical protein
VERKWDHHEIDRANEAAALLIAKRLRHDRELHLAARANLQRWMARDGDHPRAVFQEWNLILQKLTRDEIADFLESGTPRARRLQQSSPFMGLLERGEIEEVERVHEERRI